MCSANDYRNFVFRHLKARGKPSKNYSLKKECEFKELDRALNLNFAPFIPCRPSISLVGFSFNYIAMNMIKLAQ